MVRDRIETVLFLEEKVTKDREAKVAIKEINKDGEDQMQFTVIGKGI